MYKIASDYVDTIQTNIYAMNVLTCCDPSIVCQALIPSYNTIWMQSIWWKRDATKTIFVNGRNYPSVKSPVFKLLYCIGESKTNIMNDSGSKQDVLHFSTIKPCKYLPNWGNCCHLILIPREWYSFMCYASISLISIISLDYYLD